MPIHVTPAVPHSPTTTPHGPLPTRQQCPRTLVVTKTRRHASIHPLPVHPRCASSLASSQHLMFRSRESRCHRLLYALPRHHPSFGCVRHTCHPRILPCRPRPILGLKTSSFKPPFFAIWLGIAAPERPQYIRRCTVYLWPLRQGGSGRTQCRRLVCLAGSLVPVTHHWNLPNDFSTSLSRF